MRIKHYMTEISNKELREKAKKVKFFFSDVDGTLTDGCVYYSERGEAMKKFSLRDGSGFFLLRQAGIKSGIITGENSPIVERRSEKLNVDKLIMNAVPKLESLKAYLDSVGLDFSNVAYIGDSINDVQLLQKVGLGFAVGDADDLVKSKADIICRKSGGNGAFLEAVEVLLDLAGANLPSIIELKL